MKTKSRTFRILAAIGMLIGVLLALFGFALCLSIREGVGAALCLPTAAAVGWMLVRDVRALLA